MCGRSSELCAGSSVSTRTRVHCASLCVHACECPSDTLCLPLQTLSPRCSVLRKETLACPPAVFGQCKVQPEDQKARWTGWAVLCEATALISFHNYSFTEPSGPGLAPWIHAIASQPLDGLLLPFSFPSPCPHLCKWPLINFFSPCVSADFFLSGS